MVDVARRSFLYNDGGGLFRRRRGREDEKKSALGRDDVRFAVYQLWSAGCIPKA
jgi:hypothetical protein